MPRGSEGTPEGGDRRLDSVRPRSRGDTAWCAGCQSSLQVLHCRSGHRQYHSLIASVSVSTK